MTTQPSVPPEMFDINAVRVSADEWDKNGLKSADGRCMVCNRPVNDAQASTWWVWMATDSKLFPMDADDAAAAYEHDDMGLQPVGATCARKIPKAYRTRPTPNRPPKPAKDKPCQQPSPAPARRPTQ